MPYSLYKRIYQKIYCILWRITFAQAFRYFGKKSTIFKPDILTGEKYISIGDGVNVSSGSWISAIKIDDAEPDLQINSGTQIGRYSHIIAVRELIIGKNVLIADKVYISDNVHTFSNASTPILMQPVEFRNKVNIEDGVWIGENVCIIGASIGRGSVVAAGAVVLNDMPERCLIAGVPAKIVKYLDAQ